MFPRVVISFLVFATFASAAMAQNSDARDQAARTLFEAGRVQYMQSQYEEAAEHWERAYALSGRPRLLFNLGNAYAHLERYEDARRVFLEYLLFVPESERPFVDQRIHAVDRSIAIQDVIREHMEATRLRFRASTPTTSTASVDETEHLDEASTVEVHPTPGSRSPATPPLAAPAAPAASSDAASSTSFVSSLQKNERALNPSRHLWTWLTLGAGAALATTGGLLWRSTQRRFSTLANSCGSTDLGCSPQQVDSLSRRATVSRLTLGLSAASLVAATVLYFVEPQPTERRVTFGGLGINGTF